MTVYALSSNPPGFWDDACKSGGSLFNTSGWQEVLSKSFSAQTVYASKEARRSGAAYTIFSAGPFNVAYQGFPLGSWLGDTIDYAALAEVWRRVRGKNAPVCLRIPVSGFLPLQPLPYPFVETPETAITDLQNWDICNASTNVRRDVKKAFGSELQLVESAGPDNADAIYDIYKDTIRRHKGSLRYSRAYFGNLTKLSGASSRLRVSVALVGDKVGAFNVSAIEGLEAYYLHGGISPEASPRRPGALLMERAIRWAKKDGCTSFNFLSSPAGQPSLVRYKEKWGGITRPHRTYTIKLGAAYPIFHLAEAVYSKLG